MLLRILDAYYPVRPGSVKKAGYRQASESPMPLGWFGQGREGCPLGLTNHQGSQSPIAGLLSEAAARLQVSEAELVLVGCASKRSLQELS
jgi:hypothetical protein